MSVFSLVEEPRYLAKIGLSLDSFSDSLKEVFYILMLSTERSQKKIIKLKRETGVIVFDDETVFWLERWNNWVCKLCEATLYEKRSRLASQISQENVKDT